MFLEACNFEGALFFRGLGPVNIEVLPFSLSKIDSSVVVIAPVGRKRLLLRRFSQKIDETTQFVEFASSSTIESILANFSSQNISTCLVDSLDLLIELLGADAVCKLIHRLKSSRLLVSHCHEKTVALSDWNRLLAVADQYYLVQVKGKQEIVADGVLYKKNGKITAVSESLQILPDLKMKSRKYEETLPEVVEKEEPAPSAPFNMGLLLKESERAAKEQLELPYMSSSNAEGLVNLRSSEKKVRVGGQIIYEPDEADDLDDSDPDDDLNL